MADVNAQFNYDADFGSAISETQRLAKELSVLNQHFNALDKNARTVRNEIGQTFTAAVGDLGGFSAKTVDITSNIDNFGKALDRNKLKLRDYYREASRAFNAQSNTRKLAEDQVRRTKAQLVELGMDATGRRKGILVTPMKLDMTDMGNQLEVAKKQFSIFNKLVQDGATHLINWGKNTQWAGRQLTVGLTVPMTMFATTTAKAFMDVDKELTRFQKVYGGSLVASTTQATAAIRGQVQALAVEMASKYGIAAKETAGLAADLAATGLEGKKLLDSTRETTRLAVLGEVDRQDAMKATLSLQSAFNLNTKELADSINFLNAVENQTSTSLTDLTEAIPKAGPVVKALGGDVKDLSVLLVAMKEGGIGAAEGANAIKSGLASLINPTKQASESAKKYGINLDQIVSANKGKLMPTVLAFQQSIASLDDFSKSQIIEQIFGKYQFARMSALFDNLNKSGSQTQQVIKLMAASSADLAKVANQEIKTLTESTSMRFQRSMESIKAAMLPIGQTIVTAVLPFMDKFANLLKNITDTASNLPGPIKSFLKLSAGLTAIAGPIVMITGVLGNFLGYIQKGAMGFVNLGRRMAGMPVEQFSILNDEQIASAKATDMLTVSIDRQKSAMVGLVALMNDYNLTLREQATLTPNLFQGPLPSSSEIDAAQTRTVPRRRRIRRQTGDWVPGSGEGDKVPAMLEPGEFVVNKKAAQKHGGLLESLNSGTQRFATGGGVLSALQLGAIKKWQGDPSAFRRMKTNANGSQSLNQNFDKDSLWTLLSSLGKSGSGINARRATKINPNIASELSKQDAAMLVGALQSGDYNSLFGKQLNFNGLASFAQNTGGKNPYGFMGIDRFHSANSGKGMDIFFDLMTGKNTRGRDISGAAIGDWATMLNELLTYKLQSSISGVSSDIKTRKPIVHLAGHQSGGIIHAIRGIRVRGAYSAPAPIKKMTNALPMWSTYDDEIKQIINAAERSGNPLGPEQLKELQNTVAAHISSRTGTKFGVKWKIWNPKNLVKDSQWINNYLANNGMFGRMDLSTRAIITNRARSSYGIPEEEAASILEGLLKGKHPTTKEEAQVLLELAKLDKYSKYLGGAQNIVPALESRLAGDFYPTLASRKYSGPTYYVEMGQSSDKPSPEHVWKPGGKGGAGSWVIPDTGKTSRSKPNIAYQGLMNRKQTGGPAWVPGTGSGDRVPAMLEPGEFVVNKKAAMKYGGLLHEMNFKDAPRFALGGKLGATSVAVGTGAQLATMLPGFQNLSPALQDLTNKIMMTSFAFSMLNPVIGKIAKSEGIKKLGGKIMGEVADAKTNRLLGREVLKGGKAATGLSRLQGAGMVARGMIFTPWGLAAAAVVAASVAWYVHYQNQIKQAKAATQEAFSAGTKTAQQYGVELQNINDKLKENQDVTKAVGLNATTAATSTGVSADKKAAIAEDNKNFIDALKKSQGSTIAYGQLGGARGAGYNISGQTVQGRGFQGQGIESVTTGNIGKQKGMLLTKFATLRQQGFSQQDAMDVVTEIAKQAGDQTLTTLQSLRPQLDAMAGDNLSKVYAESQKAQLGALKDMKITSENGSMQAFQEGFKGAMTSLQYAPPEQQLQAMSDLISSMNSLDATQLENAGKALSDMAKEQYGSGSSIAKTIDALTKTGNLSDTQKALKLDTAAKAGMSNDVILKITADNQITSEEQKLIDTFLNERDVRVKMDIQIQENAKEKLADIDKKINAQNTLYQNQLDANDRATKSENDRYDAAQKHYAAFIKAKQKEIDGINKGADAYINSLQKQSQADKFYSDQSKTAMGGLSSLASGDVFGFAQAQQQMADNARQYSFNQEIQNIDDKRKAAVDALQAQIEKEQELAAGEDERHQNNLKALEAQRDKINKNNAVAMKGLLDQQAMWQQLSSYSGPAFDSIMAGYSATDVEAMKVGATNAAVNYLMTHPEATVEQAIAEGKKFMQNNHATSKANIPSETNNPGSSFQGVGTNRYANGGHITGPGTGTSDSIPAMLSNGEYVVKASAVSQYGTGMLDAINTQKFADGGLVRPVKSAANNGYPYGENGHLGTDFGNGGDEVHAAHSGRISYSEIHMDPDGVHSAKNKNPNRRYGGGLASYGKVLRIVGDGWTTLYAHLANAIVKSGQVNQNDPIGISGGTGNAFGDHLHFETFRNGKRMNPLSAISGRYSGDTGANDTSGSPAEPKKTDKTDITQSDFDVISKAFGISAEVFNLTKQNGISALLGRKFGGSMSMNKPYMVGENGPEVFLPYGSGGRVAPINFNTPKMNQGGIINNAGGAGQQVNIHVNGVNDPHAAAARAVQLLEQRNRSRDFGGSFN